MGLSFIGYTLPCLIIGGEGSNKERGWVVNTNFLKLMGHNKVSFRASYNFIGKMSGWELGGCSNFEYRTGHSLV